MLTYFPPHSILNKAFGIDVGTAPNSEKVIVSVAILKLLLKAALLSAPFDEKIYLESNPDLREAWESGHIADLRTHYIENGYLEGRSAEPKQVDEEWYLSHYKDVSLAVREGVLISGQEHYEKVGATEWRAPNRSASPMLDSWRRAILGNQ
jgi:hypothetical protein